MRFEALLHIRRIGREEPSRAIKVEYCKHLVPGNFLNFVDLYGFDGKKLICPDDQFHCVQSGASKADPIPSGTGQEHNEECEHTERSSSSSGVCWLFEVPPAVRFSSSSDHCTLLTLASQCHPPALAAPRRGLFPLGIGLFAQHAFLLKDLSAFDGRLENRFNQAFIR